MHRQKDGRPRDGDTERNMRRRPSKRHLSAVHSEDTLQGEEMELGKSKLPIKNGKKGRESSGMFSLGPPRDNDQMSSPSAAFSSAPSLPTFPLLLELAEKKALVLVLCVYHIDIV